MFPVPTPLRRDLLQFFPCFTTGRIVLTLTSRLNCCRPPCSPAFMEKRAPSPAPRLTGRARGGAASAALALALSHAPQLTAQTQTSHLTTLNVISPLVEWGSYRLPLGDC